MTAKLRRSCDWKKRARILSAQLGRAHKAANALGTALDEGDGKSVECAEEVAHDAVRFVAKTVKTFHAEQPPPMASEIDTEGAYLAVGGAGVATVALDVMVNAMVALAGTDDVDDTDFLVSARLDAELAYEAGVAVVEAVPKTDGPGMADLERALSTEGTKALTHRVTQARPQVLAIKDRSGSMQGRG